MKTVTVRAEWVTTTQVEVPDDAPDNIMEWDDEHLEQITSANAELVDWSWK